ncbi:MAG: hypothetical protein NWE93_07210 [Candidatus Bathyarchaeota archaeon]|nr:hypothetical protein [Candidatus Bathyarchaeota archaeon]
MKKHLVYAFIALLVSSLFAAGYALAEATPVQPLSSPVIIATPTPPPLPTTTPTSTPTPPPTPVPSISLDYEEVSQATDGDETVVTLRVTASYNFGETVTYNFGDFVLDIRSARGGIEDTFHVYLLTGTAQPLETGSVTVGATNPHAEFTLTFRFSTIQSSYGGPTHFAYYELVYKANAASPAPQPTTPSTPTDSPTTTPSPVSGDHPVALDFEQTAIVVFAIVVALLTLAVVVLLNRRKTRNSLDKKPIQEGFNSKTY